MKKTLFISTAATLLAFLSGIANGQNACPSSDIDMSQSQNVGVSGNSMTMNGHRWCARSVVLQALAAPKTPKVSGWGRTPAQQNANDAFNLNWSGELAALRSWGIDTLRFQMSQRGMNPNDPHVYDPNYLSDFEAAVAKARAAGFVVILMMQDEAPSGNHDPQNPDVNEANSLATQMTQDNWDVLTDKYKNDLGVIFELYNEPEPDSTNGAPDFTVNTANWNLWYGGGQVTNANGTTITAIGMQNLLTHVRNRGANNVVLIDGLRWAMSLKGLKPLTDPKGKIVYAVHPYQHGSDSQDDYLSATDSRRFKPYTPNNDWDLNFGNASATYPVFADEWLAPSNNSLGLDQLGTFQVAVDLLNYLRNHGISIGGGAFDIPTLLNQGAINGSSTDWTPTNYNRLYGNDGDGTPTSGDDSGLLTQKMFQGNYSHMVTYPNGGITAP